MTSLTPGSGRHRGKLASLPGRIPLRVKLITALLALVVIALSVISFTSLIAFRDYLMGQAGSQVTAIYEQKVSRFANPGQFSGPTNPFTGPNGGLGPDLFGAYGPYLVELLGPHGRVIEPVGLSGQPIVAGPVVPTSKSWFKANSGRLVTLSGQNGSDNWRVIAREITVQLRNTITGQSSETTVILVVGMDLGSVEQTIGWLGRIDLFVSAIIVLALVVVGIAIVRASLRPLTDIEQTAEAIAAGDLSRRVPDRDPGTEVGRLGRSLNTMLAQIETSFHARAESEAAARRSEERMRQFVADASHELRTPLTAMRGYAEYYRQRGGVTDEQAASQPVGGTAGRAAAGAAAAGNGTAGGGASLANGNGPLSRVDLDRIMQRVEQESARMGVLVEDMLLLARLDQQRPIEHRPVDLLTLAADAVQDARMIAPQRRIDLTVGSGAAFLVLGDEVRLRQVIGNLMTNALTHTPEDTPIDVRILAGRQDSVPAVALEVADQGPGLRADQAEHVFERFYRADQARTRRAGGAGLGLAIVSALVAAHGGTVAVDTAPGQGATFRITLPLAPEAQEDPSDQDESPTSGNPPP